MDVKCLSASILLTGFLLSLSVNLVVAEADSTKGSVIYVDHTAAGPEHDGLSWMTALTSVSEALELVDAGDEIWVARGVYRPGAQSAQGRGDRTATFVMKDGVALYGGFAGVEAQRDQRDWVSNVTVLSGDIDVDDVTDESGVVSNRADIVGGNAFNVVTARDVGKTARLDGFFVTAGQATGEEHPHYYGGGMVIFDGGHPTVANVTFTGNQARTGTVGGMYRSEDSSPTLENVTFGSDFSTSGVGESQAEDGGRVYAGEAASSSDTGPIDYYGKSIDVLGLFGREAISETARNRVDGNAIYHAPGVVVDRNSPPDRLYIYVVDSGNNRMLGFDFECAHGDTCPMDGNRPADIIIGQPNSSKASCNGDSNLGFDRAPSDSTLCLLGYPVSSNTAECWQRINFDVDSLGNLYVPDFWNNRVLRYNAPFSTDRTSGKGDAIADFVWGQEDMVTNGRNRGSNYGAADAPDGASLWISDGRPFFDHVSSRGISVDDLGNLWVADTYNSRVLRFGPASKNADLVLGQADFRSSGCVANGPLDRMCTPTLARVNPATGELFVLDEYPAPFIARILVFRPPFSNGMEAYKVIVPIQDGPFTNWGAWDGTGAYRFQSTGFVFNTYRQGEYANGEIWLNELETRRTLLISRDGAIIDVIGAPNEFMRGGDASFPPECGSIYSGNHLFDPGGSIGIDSAHNIYLADEIFHTVYRYSLPYDTYQVGSATCLPEASGVLFPKGPNKRSSDRVGESHGLAVSGDQLLVRDEGNRLKAYDAYFSMPWGADVDHLLQGGFQPGNWLSAAIDDSRRLWLAGEHLQVSIYQLPITSSTDAPIADYVRLYWADTGLEVARPAGDSYVRVGAIAYDPVGQAIYIVDAIGSRIFRVSNYREVDAGLQVDMVIGQRDKTEVRCNQGLNSPNAGTLCEVTQIKFDGEGNLYAVDNAYECHGNHRIVVFEARDLAGASGLFPNLQARKVFNAPSLTEIGDCAYWTVGKPGSPVNIAFNSMNQLVVGNDGYYGDLPTRALRQLWFYSNPLAKQEPDAYIELYMGTPGELAFDNNDNLLIRDGTWYKVWLLNLSCDPEWLVPLPGVPTPLSLPPCVTPTPTPTPTTTPTSTTTPSSTPTATPTTTPTATATPHLLCLPLIVRDFPPPPPLLKLLFEGSFAGEDGEVGVSTGVTFSDGYHGQGALFGEGDVLHYRTAGNMGISEGAIEFWVRPSWDGGDGQSYVFFEVGDTWPNRMCIMKDGAENLRFIVWGDEEERDVSTGVSDWRSGGWHHVRSEWHDQTISLLVDGELVATRSQVQMPSNLADRLYVGSSGRSSYTAEAVVDEFVIHQRSWTEW